MPRFMLLAYDDPAAMGELSAEAMQAIVERYIAWTEELAQSGRLLASEKLADDGGRRVGRRAGQVVVRDGPFVESREVLGGYWLVRAADYAEAMDIAEGCPHVALGELEVRAVEELE
jgi:hypothetical protein